MRLPPNHSCVWTGTCSFTGDLTGDLDDTLRLRIRLTSKSRRDAIVGLIQTADGQAIKATVRALPQDGAANKAVQALIAKWLAMPKSSIILSAGAKSRTKILTIIADKPDRSRIIDQINQLSTN